MFLPFFLVVKIVIVLSINLLSMLLHRFFRSLSALLFALCAVPNLVFSQSANVPFDADYYHLIDRYEIKQTRFFPGFHSTVKPFDRQAIATFADSLHTGFTPRSDADLFNVRYLLRDNWEWAEHAQNEREKPILKFFYRNNSDALHVEEKDFGVHFSPITHFSVGFDPEFDASTYINTRGAVIRGSIGKKIGFFSSFTENQARFVGYVQEWIDSTKAVPGERFWKVLSESSKNVTQFELDEGVDFMQARGYITFVPAGPVQLQLGHDRHKFGNGYRSMLLSGESPDYFFLRANTRVWKLQYTNLYAQMNTRAPLNVNTVLPKKYFVMHHLSMNVLPNLNIGLFESVMFGRDSLNNGFELEYLNPIIVYRAVELGLGDVDNVNIGMDFRWNFLDRFQLYGQLMLDDLAFSEFRRRSGWHGNKWGTQIGMKYIDVGGIANLDLQLEYNAARPYTYSHVVYPDGANHQHYGQPLAHPLGANFRELIAVVRYQPIPRLWLTGKFMASERGEDAAPNENNGGNIFLDYNTNRTSDFGNTTLQGTRSQMLFADFTASYHLFHNCFLDAKLVVRSWETPEANLIFSNTVFPSLSLRWNTAQRLHEF